MAASSRAMAFPYSIISLKFDSEVKVVIVPSKWYDNNKNTCRYPPSCQYDQSEIDQLIFELSNSRSSWPKVDVVVLHSCSG